MIDWGYVRSWITYVLLYPIKKRRMQQFFGENLTSFNIVFDIGAHLGDKTRFFADHGISVVSLEPQPKYFQKLLATFADYNNVKVINKGVASEIGQLSLQISNRYPTVSTFSDEFTRGVSKNMEWKKVAWDETIEVEVVTLDHLIDEHGRPDFVKIDVEGFEPQVLSGLSKSLPLISFELLPAYPSSAKECITILEEIGDYQYLFSVGETFVKMTEWMNAKTMEDWIDTYLVSNQKSGDIYAKNFENKE